MGLYVSTMCSTKCMYLQVKENPVSTLFHLGDTAEIFKINLYSNKAEHKKILGSRLLPLNTM